MISELFIEKSNVLTLTIALRLYSSQDVPRLDVNAA